jgi:hypothetical protein
VSTEISSQLASHYPVISPVVICPSGVPDSKGKTFTCTASMDGQTLHIDGIVTGAGGHFTAAPKEAVVLVAQRTQQLTRDIASQAHTKANVDCTSRTLLVVPVDNTFPCTVTFVGQKPRSVTVKVVDAQGDFTYTVAPARR